jgi:hypothetical protein
MRIQKTLKNVCAQAMQCTIVLVTFTTLSHAQMPPGLHGVDHYAIRKIDESEPCKFEREYYRIRSKKSDPRVAFIDLHPLVHKGEAPLDFQDLCAAVSQQSEDGVVVFDRRHAFLHLLFGDEATVSDAITYFSGPSKSPGVILYVTRRDIDWRSYIFEYRNNKWKDVTDQYLGPFHLGKKDYVVAPQYGRTARVLTFDGTRFHHKLWLTWDGTKFTASTTRKIPGWRCPDSYRYFAPSEREQYCR